MKLKQLFVSLCVMPVVVYGQYTHRHYIYEVPRTAPFSEAGSEALWRLSEQYRKNNEFRQQQQIQREALEIERQRLQHEREMNERRMRIEEEDRRRRQSHDQRRVHQPSSQHRTGDPLGIRDAQEEDPLGLRRQAETVTQQEMRELRDENRQLREELAEIRRLLYRQLQNDQETEE